MRSQPDNRAAMARRRLAWAAAALAVLLAYPLWSIAQPIDLFGGPGVVVEATPAGAARRRQSIVASRDGSLPLNRRASLGTSAEAARLDQPNAASTMITKRSS